MLLRVLTFALRCSPPFPPPPRTRRISARRGRSSSGWSRSAPPQGHGQVPPMVAYIQETLRAGGVPDADMVVIPHEETAAMLVRIPAGAATPMRRPILFSAHMDVVDARPEDWERSPFTLVEENGYFFGRGVLDNKTGDHLDDLDDPAAARRPASGRARTLVFAFIGDEETTFGTTRLVAAHPWVRGRPLRDQHRRRRRHARARRPAARLSGPGRGEDLRQLPPHHHQSRRPFEPAARRQCDLRPLPGACSGSSNIASRSWPTRSPAPISARSAGSCRARRGRC